MNCLSSAEKNKLLTILTAERNVILELIEILKKEQNSLTQGNVEDILKFASDKDFKLNHLSNLYKLQSDIVPSNNLLQRSLLDKNDTEDLSLIQLWEDIQILVTSAKQLNITNESVILMNLQYSQNLSNALHGDYHNPEIYDARGIKA